MKRKATPGDRATQRSADASVTPPPPLNQLLRALPDSTYQAISSELTSVTVQSRTVLHRPGGQLDYLWFPVNCVVSVTTTMRDGRTAETGVIGRREVVGINALLGERETTQTQFIVQIPGELIRVPAVVLRAEFDTKPELRAVFFRYLQAMIAQVSQNAACNSVHNVRQRYARWLLECRDRIGSDEILVSQTFIAQMLGVRRPGISVVAGKFNGLGLTESSRGRTRILDVAGLEAVSCECYGVLREEYDRLLTEGN